MKAEHTAPLPSDRSCSSTCWYDNESPTARTVVSKQPLLPQMTGNKIPLAMFKSPAIKSQKHISLHYCSETLHHYFTGGKKQQAAATPLCPVLAEHNSSIHDYSFWMSSWKKHVCVTETISERQWIQMLTFTDEDPKIFIQLFYSGMVMTATCKHFKKWEHKGLVIGENLCWHQFLPVTMRK